jgi:hypothetical protein
MITIFELTHAAGTSRLSSSLHLMQCTLGSEEVGSE